MTDTADQGGRFFRSPRGTVTHLEHPRRPVHRIFNDLSYPEGRLVGKGACGNGCWDPEIVEGPATCPACLRYLNRKRRAPSIRRQHDLV